MSMQTPYYYYDLGLLQATLAAIRQEVAQYPNFHVHYALKANANPALLSVIRQAGLGADCVSGGEVQQAIDAGFAPKDIVYAGVGKSDWEIHLGLQHGIMCFNVESLAELEVINELAEQTGKVADVCLRINPEVEAHTHTHIITGMAENKFGIALADMASVIAKTQEMKHVRFIGLHFHIGSQITDMQDYFALCMRINELQHELNKQGIYPQVINVGGGLGIDYQHPERRPIADFKAYFHVFAQHLHLRSDQSLHFELGRSVVGQCGSLITRVLYVKQGAVKQFAIVDAGMTELIRPALYQAQHKIENLSSTSTDKEKYDVVGPICESSDVFAKDWWLPHTQRGDLLAIRSAGAYGESMASQYNCRRLPETVVETQEQLNLKYE